MFDMNVQMREIARITFATVTLALPEKDVKLDVSKIVFYLAVHLLKRVHSVLERIWIKGSYLSQWLPQGERGPPKES